MPNGAMLDGTSSKGRAALAEWRRAVADGARTWLAEHSSERPQPPYELIIAFRFAPSASNPYRWYHAIAPDADKLARAVGDSLVHAGLIADDRYISDLHVTKRFALDGADPGATIELESLAELEALQRAGMKAAAAAARRRPASTEQEALL
jgi:Holliday junction resolvase RusA-like endonuclease